ncbi:hypothetical protein GE061_013287 [Apolygus lucorum]|uniref:Uncharacterized protein n=1 Tax=Apolygus lucorum TaxID=248454 RepID=A0A6A4IZE0_APOLU|nr:hypothetical protein GE061_013287 [Apolygus lucorum]
MRKESSSPISIHPGPPRSVFCDYIPRSGFRPIEFALLVGDIQRHKIIARIVGRTLVRVPSLQKKTAGTWRAHRLRGGHLTFSISWTKLENHYLQFTGSSETTEGFLPCMTSGCCL